MCFPSSLTFNRTDQSIPVLSPRKGLRSVEVYLLDRCYVRRILTLATITPDIVDAIVRGREPGGLSLERMSKGMPRMWEEQRAELGFPGFRVR
jgi:hypothetical protein